MIHIKQQEETNPAYGKPPEERTIEELLETGIINLNKPKGPTSHEASEFVKRIIKAKKAGQSGTLDPAVTGVLPIGLNRATRALQILLLGGKEYICLMHLHEDLDELTIRAMCNKFVGKIQQMPPIKSAVKRVLRTREVYYIDIIEIEGRDVLFKVGCEAGTYIRKLCDDIGKALGSGAHMTQLIRTKVGPFTDDNMYTLQDIEEAYAAYKSTDEKIKSAGEKKLRIIIKPMEMIVQNVPKIWVSDAAINSLCHGMSLAIPGIIKFTDFKANQKVALMSLKEELVGLADTVVSSEEILKAEKGIAAKTDVVLMLEEVYPKWKKS